MRNDLSERGSFCYHFHLFKEYYTIREVARLLGVDVKRIRSLASRPDDPMPFRCFKGQRRNGFIYREDLISWIEENTVLLVDCRRPDRDVGHG